MANLDYHFTENKKNIRTQMYQFIHQRAVYNVQWCKCYFLIILCEVNTGLYLISNKMWFYRLH